MPDPPDASDVLVASGASGRLARDLLALQLAADQGLTPSLPSDGAALREAVADVERAVAVDGGRRAEVLGHLDSLDGPGLARARAGAIRSAAARPAGVPAADALVAGHDSAVTGATDRRQRGAWYTPPELVDLLLDHGLEGPVVRGGVAPSDLHVLDPACGSGRFVLAAHRRLVAAGAEPSPGSVRGVDADPDAVEVLRLALWLELADPSVTLGSMASWIVHGDALPATTTAAGAAPVDWATVFGDVLADRPDRAGGFDLVVGNPPFASPMRGGGPTDRAAAAALAARFDGDVAGYANPAVAFLALAVDLARPDGGRVAMVQPLSTLAARDAGPVRRRLLERAALDGLWVDGRPVFDAGVRTCAVVARRGSAQVQPPRCWAGLPAVAVEPDGAVHSDAPWGPVVARAFGVPRVVLRSDETLGSRCRATADFRRQYYGLTPAVVDLGAGTDPTALPDGLAPVVTSGLIGPAACWWGRRPVRLHKRPVGAPAADLAVLADDPSMVRWVEARRIPKVLVATQGPVVEAFVDVDGRWLPSVPVLTVTTDPEQLWAVAAVLVSPATAAWAAARRLGAALSPGGITLAARHIAELPLPADHGAWHEAAAVLAEAQAAASAGDLDAWRGALERFAVVAVAAAGLDPVSADEVRRWWLGRLPTGGVGRPRSGRLVT